jgi:hypothetical protein
VPEERFQFIRHLGYFRKVSADRVNPATHKVDSWFSLWCSQNSYKKLPKLRVTHGVVHPNYRGMRNQLMLFDRDYNIKFDDELLKCLNWSKNIIIDYLRTNNVFTTKLEFEEIDFNFQASPGSMYNSVYKTKGDLITDFSMREKLKSFINYDGPEKECWSLSPKIDYLPHKKIFEENFRCFEIPPLPTAARCMSVCQSFNKKLYTIHGSDSPIKVGVSFQHGGFNALFQSFAHKFPNFIIGGEGDCEKYDKTIQNTLRLTCRDIRKALIFDRDKYVEISKLLDAVYDDSMNTYVSLPWGQVVLIPGGMKSGDPDTTSDNTLMHFEVLLSFVKFYFPEVSSFREAMAKLFFALFSDDHLFMTND